MSSQKNPFPYRELFRWYRKSGRHDMPWRKTRDPYRVWLSEIMLQQTTVQTVRPYYDRFLKRFPTVLALSRAQEEEVLGLWAGLGYYARARNLRRCAQEVSKKYEGAFPSDRETLHALPGIGRYTAGAVRAFAFDLPAPVVDGNIERVLCRFAGHKIPDQKTVWALAESLVPKKSARDYTLALMDLGAVVCVPRAPLCLLCPLRKSCRARQSGRPEDYALPPKPIQKKEMSVAAALIEDDGRVLLEKFPPRGLFGGLWGPPSAPVTGQSPLQSLNRLIRKRRWRLRIVSPLTPYERTLTHRIMKIYPFLCVPQMEIAASDHHIWQNRRKISGVPTAFRRIFSDKAATR